MKNNLKTFPWGHGAPTTAEWARKFKAELRKVLENPNIYCNNCKDLSAENVIKTILGEQK